MYRDGGLPLDVDRSIVVAGMVGWVHGLDRATGAVRWAVDLDAWGNVAVGFRHGVLACSADVEELVRLDYLSGALIWKVTTAARGPAAIVIEEDSIVCAKGGWVECFEHDGRRRWAQSVNRGRGAGGITLALPGNVAQAPDLQRPR